MGKIPGSEVAMATPEPSSWLSLKVFFLRVSRCEVNESMLDSLTVTHAPLTPDTVLEVNGGSVVSNGHVSLRLNRAGGVGAAVSEGGDSCTFVSTADVRVSGSVRFEVQCGGERFLVGILDTRDAGGGGWVMKCLVAAQRGSGLLRRGSKETKPPVVEVYVAGLARGAPVVFTRAMQLRFRRRRHVKAFMEPIPEHGEPAEDAKETLPPKHETEVSEYRCYKPEQDAGDADYDGFYMKPAGEEDDDGGDFSWFTAGVRVGVGISVGICLGIGIGAGLLARSYHSTSRSLRSRLISSLF